MKKRISGQLSTAPSWQPSPIPKKHVETTKREVQRLCDLGILKWEDDSEWASPTFIVPKKDNTVWVVSNFRDVNKRVVRKPFTIPKISTVLQEVEGFAYATSLDLNMGYYTIRLDPDAFKICTNIFPWAKMSELMATLEFVRTYLDDLLCISKGSLEDHPHKLRRVFIRLRDAGLIVNARKSSFCAVETKYLGYVLTIDGIEPQPKKVQAILAITPRKMLNNSMDSWACPVLNRHLGKMQ
eukprot:CCRYP_012344-RA/>CCRYP_012344-RA protein AED:0.42 eAED:0.44 QI:0/0/0/1/0.5/0.33/3/0/239